MTDTLSQKNDTPHTVGGIITFDDDVEPHESEVIMSQVNWQESLEIAAWNNNVNDEKRHSNFEYVLGKIQDGTNTS